MRDVRTGAFLGTACLLAGIGPFVLPGQGAQRVAAALAFCVPAALPLFTSDRALGLALVAVAVGLVAFGTVGGVFVADAAQAPRVLLLRNFQMASAGAASAALLTGILWARDELRSARA